MIGTVERLHAAIRQDLIRARHELADAKLRARQKDSPGNREALLARLSQMDAVLDRYLLAQRIRG